MASRRLLLLDGLDDLRVHRSGSGLVRAGGEGSDGKNRGEEYVFHRGGNFFHLFPGIQDQIEKEYALPGILVRF